MKTYRTDYEFEEGSNQPNSPIALVIIITWVLIMVIGLVSMQSCKVNVPPTLVCDTAQTKVGDTFVYDKDEINEVMPKRKD